MEGAQERLRRGGPASPELHRAGRGHPAQQASRGCCGRSPALADADGLRVANVFHAGDGNLHPLVLYDGRDPGPGAARRRSWPAEILRICMRYGGSHHRRARRGRRQGAVHGGDVHDAGPGAPWSWCAAPSIPGGPSTRARCSPRRGCAATGPGPYTPAPHRGGGGSVARRDARLSIAEVQGLRAQGGRSGALPGGGDASHAGPPAAVEVLLDGAAGRGSSSTPRPTRW